MVHVFLLFCHCFPSLLSKRVVGLKKSGGVEKCVLMHQNWNGGGGSGGSGGSQHILTHQRGNVVVVGCGSGSDSGSGCGCGNAALSSSKVFVSKIAQFS